jgi:hypothetical protein
MHQFSQLLLARAAPLALLLFASFVLVRQSASKQLALAAQLTLTPSDRQDLP